MTIRVHTNESVAIDSVLELLEMQEWSDVTLNRLRQVEMRSLSGSRPELEFIKLLFAKSPVLETMLIEPNSAVVVDRGLGILKEASRFRRLSPRAEIKFENSDVDQRRGRKERKREREEEGERGRREEEEEEAAAVVPRRRRSRRSSSTSSQHLRPPSSSASDPSPPPPPPPPPPPLGRRQEKATEDPDSYHNTHHTFFN
ncbi:hypothetical protein HYC85_015612 [Camellia sinensis]|uniref:FBD domain-containing protein n=1 Tax=Camellia sinensis TaxID=4442 RepID=A0A7J7H0W0_CAMSI|nr:hypothetical protein HYC85_015612 [Camellia sinensis]